VNSEDKERVRGQDTESGTNGRDRCDFRHAFVSTWLGGAGPVASVASWAVAKSRP
jgi:hypothetical protein